MFWLGFVYEFAEFNYTILPLELTSCWWALVVAVGYLVTAVTDFFLPIEFVSELVFVA